MIFATLASDESRDGELLLVNRARTHAVRATSIVGSLREAIEGWNAFSPKLKELDSRVDSHPDLFQIDLTRLHSPFPRTFQWADGSAFIEHVRLVRKARGAEVPETLMSVPLMYQGGGDDFLRPLQKIPQIDFSHGTDFEGEFAVVTDDVPMGVSPQEALETVRLLLVCNDVSLRGLIPQELKSGFGFFQGKPSSSFAPFALTPDELGSSWSGGRVHLPLSIELNGEPFGTAHGKEMHFHFGDLIAHAARTRRLRAGTIIGSGTVSNEDRSRGSSCLAEKRMIEKIEEGVIKTPFMKPGDVVRMEVFNSEGVNLFGTIEQEVVPYP